MLKRCIICNKQLYNDINFLSLIRKRKICSECFSQLEYVRGGCPRCGKEGDGSLCSECKHWDHLFQKEDMKIRNYSLYRMNDFTRDIIYKAKYKGDSYLLHAFKSDLQRLLKNIINEYRKDVVLIPVPIVVERLIERGFNQNLVVSYLLKKQICDIIITTRNSKQSKKNRVQRLKLDNDFHLRDDLPNFKNKLIIIIDDIYTTGATINQIALCLRQRYSGPIISLTLLRS